MQLEFREATGHPATYGLSGGAYPTVTATAAEVLAHSGMGGGPSMAHLIVTHPDGRRALVMVTARLNGRGRVVFELVAHHHERSVRARLTAFWQRARQLV